MPRPTPYERARGYVSRMPAAVSGNHGHHATFAVAMVLMQGFDLPRHEARTILDEYNARAVDRNGSPCPWSDRELEHKLSQADKQSGFKTQDGLEPRGYLRDLGGEDKREQSSSPTQAPTPRPAPQKPTYDPEKLKRAAGQFADIVDVVWLANRSTKDPALVTSATFLRSIYRAGEKVLVFTNQWSQGEAMWPGDELPTTGKLGVWYLCQPVTGEYLPNPRGKKKAGDTIPMSRRIEECVTDWRYFVLESDDAPAREWLGALVQLPLRIAAIYTSGKRSVHALVRVDARTKAEWDDLKYAMQAGLLILGADAGAMSAVRLTRLPGCMREGHEVEREIGGKKRKVYEAFPKPAPQKLLYLNPEAPMRPLCDMLAKRDVVTDWLKLSGAGVADGDATGGDWIRKGLAYYARNERIRAALASFPSPEAAG